LARQNFQEIDHSITLCPPKLHPIYFVSAVLTFVAPPVLLTIYVALTEFECLNSKIAMIFGILPTIIIGFIPAFLYLYFYVPFLAVYHGIQGFYTDKLESVKRFPHIDDARDITFLKLFEQFGEALPQFMLGMTYYVSNTYFVNTNDNLFDLMLPTTLISMVFSGVSVGLGLISGLVSTKGLSKDGLLR
jgi:hypothetical protein